MLGKSFLKCPLLHMVCLFVLGLRAYSTPPHFPDFQGFFGVGDEIRQIPFLRNGITYSWAFDEDVLGCFTICPTQPAGVVFNLIDLFPPVPQFGVVSAPQSADVHLLFSAEVFVVGSSCVHFLAQFVFDLVFVGFPYLGLGGVVV